jgi:hypothetical protein
MEIIDGIRQFYNRNRISPGTYRQFGCPDKKLCHIGCDRLTTGNEPMIGSKYERRERPRLLIISAEPAEGGRRISDRTIEGHARWEAEEKEVMNGRSEWILHPRTHWFKTAQLAIWIYEVIETGSASRWVWRRNHDREFPPAASYWAHTNGL